MGRLARILEVSAAALLIVLMLITGIDVVGRYVLNAPLPGAFETTQLVLAALIFTALPLVGRAGGHVEVDLVAAALPERLAHALGLVAALLSAAVLLFFAYRLAVLAGQQWEDGTRSVSLGIPYAPVALLGAASATLAAAFALRRAWRGRRGGTGADDPR